MTVSFRDASTVGAGLLCIILAAVIVGAMIIGGEASRSVFPHP